MNEQPDLLAPTEGDRVSTFRDLWTEASENERAAMRAHIHATEHAHDPLHVGAARVLSVINDLTDSRYRDVPNTRKPIVERLREGVTQRDCVLVVRYMAQRWKGTKWESNLNPLTLFRPANFDRYLGWAKGAEQRVRDRRAEEQRSKDNAPMSKAAAAEALNNLRHMMNRRGTTERADVLVRGSPDDLSSAARKVYDDAREQLRATKLDDETAHRQAMVRASHYEDTHTEAPPDEDVPGD